METKEQQLTVLCANIGWKWPDNWVYRLERMVSKNCSVPYRFICVSDHHIEGIETKTASKVELNKHKPQGCWAKLDFFRRDVSGNGPCIGLDLDITIVGDIAELIRDNLTSSQDPRSTDKYMNSSVLAWTPSAETDAIYTNEIPYALHPKGDQEYIAGAFPHYDTFDNVYSFKGHMQGRDKLKPGTIVVFFHGHPTPADHPVMSYEWNARTWDGIEVINRQ